MNKPGAAILEKVMLSHAVEGLTISDGYSIRNVAHAEQRDTLRLPRGDDYDVTLVASKKFYDGSGGGKPGSYALIFVEFRATGSRWRTAGVKIRNEEAPRIARDMLKGKASKPGRNEPPRVGGKTIANGESELRGIAVSGGGYLVFVRHKMRGEAWGRTRGVEILPAEKTIVAGLLKQLVEAA